ncbi:polycystic kidney disease protein 1-like 2 [Plakobranchus ocellatus]|uniref:Polycystic kidney disease protein 1-like 2 n=1 Tax=Plakobranchus ocellatus TaxID=259542 RepID=A0AAV4ACC4_9GAST|nr:polycystic kidney disease protein 1-like 2 [Plakobranchus ocellatus]
MSQLLYHLPVGKEKRADISMPLLGLLTPQMEKKCLEVALNHSTMPLHDGEDLEETEVHEGTITSEEAIKDKQEEKEIKVEARETDKQPDKDITREQKTNERQKQQCEEEINEKQQRVLKTYFIEYRRQAEWACLPKDSAAGCWLIIVVARPTKFLYSNLDSEAGSYWWPTQPPDHLRSGGMSNPMLTPTSHHRCSHSLASNCRQSLRLPYWSTYVTWSLVCVFNTLLVYNIIVQGLSLVTERSLNWLLTYFMAFLLNIILFMPLVVCLKAVIMIRVIKKEQSMGEKSPLSNLDEGLKLLIKDKASQKAIVGGKRKRLKVQQSYPISLIDASKVLERLKVESKAKEMLRELVFYTVFMITVLFIINGHIDVNMEYMQKSSVESELLGLEREDLRIENVNAVWDYLVNEVIIKLIPQIDDLRYDKSRTFYLLTHARLRQVRTRFEINYDCIEGVPEVVWPRDDIHSCSQQVTDEEVEDHRSFNDSWDRVISDTEDLSDDSPYRYHPAAELKSFAYVGQHGFYSGGGYVVRLLREDPASVQQLLTKVFEDGWIDKLSRCIFLEFIVYNPSVDMYTQVTVAFEVDLNGGIFASKTINTANLSITKRGNRLWFKVVEMLVGILTLSCVLLFLLRRNSFAHVIQQFEDTGHTFYLDFSEVFFWQNLFHLSMGFFGALVIFKMLKVTTNGVYNDKLLKTYRKNAARSTGVQVSFGEIEYFNGHNQ